MGEQLIIEAVLRLVCFLEQDFFELGVILLRKKLYTQATKNLEKASRIWDGEPEELAQVRAPAHSRGPVIGVLNILITSTLSHPSCAIPDSGVSLVLINMSTVLDLEVEQCIHQNSWVEEQWVCADW